ncbi:MAG: DNA polymerase IV [bacterium]|nr:DNA polymerase IV [bacterium]
MKNRIILHIDMDAFFATIEERENPRFKGKPVVVGAEPKEGKGRGVVATCNYEARKYGIHSAMPISQAWRLCPDAIFLPVNGALYSRVSENIMEAIKKFVVDCPVEQVSLDEAYVDLSSSVRQYSNTSEYWSIARKIGKEMRQEIWNRERLSCTVGIGPNKMVAKMACEHAKPNGVFSVQPKDVDAFLLSLSIRKIPGVGPKTEIALERFLKKKNLTTKDVRGIVKEELVNLLGVLGNSLYEKVRGIDASSVALHDEIKSIGRDYTFQKDTRDGEEILSVFRRLSLDVAQEIKEREYFFKTITVVCRFQGFETHTKSRTLKESSKDDKVLKKEAMRLLLKFLTENLKPVRLVGVHVRVVAKPLQ